MGTGWLDHLIPSTSIKNKKSDMHNANGETINQETIVPYDSLNYTTKSGVDKLEG